MMIVDVLLPLSVPGAYTYRVPEDFIPCIVQGSRVVVPLGKKKFYTGIVVRCPGTPVSADVMLKEVVEVVDERPVLLPVQLDLWRWLYRYYMCNPGEVMKAALPSGLKLESETYVEAVPDFEESAERPLLPRDRRLYDFLKGKKAESIGLIGKKWGEGKGFIPALKRLIDCGAVNVSENLNRTYRPRMETWVKIGRAFPVDESEQGKILDGMKRSVRRQELMYIMLSLPREEGISRAVLLEKCPQGAAALRELVRKEWLETFEKEKERLRPVGDGTASALPALSAAQQAAKDQILTVWKDKSVCLLHGVTSSGKTEVYIRLIAETLAAGKQVLYLLPEIALTTQITERLGRIFGARMGIYHSRVPDAEKVELWFRQLSSDAYPLILGARSALFLPFQRLGLVIVDEEHETSYKQQDLSPRYNARDTAIVLARMYGAKVLLGTATPAIETYYKAVTGKYGLVELKERYGGVRLPEIVVEDVKELRRKKQMTTPFSPRLIEEVRKALSEGGQAILFLNRRGYSPVLECHTCGWTPRCPACDVTLTYHYAARTLSCHYCGATYPLPSRCPNCEETDLRDVGCGTEKIEEQVKAVFPESRPVRMDLDTTRSRTAYERIIHDFKENRYNLLIGTQMVTKGLDFDRVKVVGILGADQMLSRPDFRAYERAFQMMAQVAGRAGRRNGRGTVILQTRQPDTDIINFVVENNYTALYDEQISERKDYFFPPFCRIVDIYFRHGDAGVCEHAAATFFGILRPSFGNDLLGPDRPSVSRVRYLHIRKLILKVRPSYSPSSVRQLLLSARDRMLLMPQYRSVSVSFDVDPL